MKAARHGVTISLPARDFSSQEGVTPAEQLRRALVSSSARVSDCFREWDDDRSGTITKAEFRRAMPSLGFNVPAKEVDAVFDLWDEDGSGEIDLKELNKQLRKGAEVELEPELRAGALGDITVKAKNKIALRNHAPPQEAEKVAEAWHLPEIESKEETSGSNWATKRNGAMSALRDEARRVEAMVSEADKRRRAAQELSESKAKANRSWLENDMDECLACLNKAVAVSRNNDTLLRYRSRVYTRRGSYDEALADASRALTLHPEDPQNLLLVGRCLHQTHKLKDASQTYLGGLSGLVNEEAMVSYKALLDAMQRDRKYYNHETGEWASNSMGKGVKVDARRDVKRQSTVTSIFDPRKIFDDGAVSARPPAPPEVRAKNVGQTEVTITWEEPEDNGGDDIYKFILQMATYEVVWEPKRNALFDDYRPFVKVGDFSITDRFVKVVTGLTPGNNYRFRVCAVNSVGQGDYDDPVTVMTRNAEQSAGSIDDAMPCSWLRVDLLDLVNFHIETTGDESPHEFFRDLAAAIIPHVHPLKVIFKAVINSLGKSEAKGVSPNQFLAFLKSVNLLVKPGASTKGRIDAATANLLFQRANAENLQRRRSVFQKGKFADLDNVAARTFANEVLEELGGAVIEDDDNGMNTFGPGNGVLHLHEFVGALCRLAWVLHGGYGNVTEDGGADGNFIALGARVSLLLEQSILPASKRILEAEDSFATVLAHRRTQAILNFYSPQLQRIFDVYAKADMSDVDVGTINVKELIFMVKEGGLFDESLSVPQLISIFSVVNSSYEDEGGDDDETELSFDEFLAVIARICNCKIPEERRNGGPFELTLQSWLHLLVIPKYNGLLADKKRGVGKKNI